jgi:hypothetical protein
MRPLEILREVMATYRRHWRVLLGAAFVLFGAFNALELLLPDIQVDHFETRAVLAAVLLGGGAFAISSFEEAFYEGIVASAAAEWRMGRARPSLIVVARLVPYLALVAVNVIVSAGSAVGLLFLFVPGFMFGTYTALAPALVKIEHLGVGAAVKRSVELVRGSFWAVAVLIWGIYFATEGATSVLDTALHGLPLEYVSTTVVEAVLAPVYGLAAVLITYDLIERRASTPPPGDAPGP